MAAEKSNGLGFHHIVIIVLLAYIGWSLTAYAPLVPKVVVFMDDVHALRGRAAEMQTTADSIRSTLQSLEHKLNFFFRREAEQRGVPWPDR